jgi:nucleoside-diphosphate-sugar epimerase
MKQRPPTTVNELDEMMTRPSESLLETLRNQQGDFAVLGAGGKMGYHLCRMLRRALDQLDRQTTVHAVSRFGSVRASEDFQAIGCNVIKADLSQPSQLESLPESENVFFLAGVKFGTAQQPELLELMNVRMPQMVAKRFRDSKIVALSTGCVYSFVTPESGGSKETDSSDPPGAYAQSCKGREQAFFDAAEQSGTASALIRLNYSIDLRYGVLVDLAQKVYRRETVDVSMGYVNVIWQGDAIDYILRSLPYAATPPFVLNVTGTGVLPVREIAAGFAKRFGCELQIQGTEAATAWLNDPAKSHVLFGEPKVSLDQMMDWVASWVEQGGELLGKPTHFEVRDGNY